MTEGKQAAQHYQYRRRELRPTQEARERVGGFERIHRQKASRKAAESEWTLQAVYKDNGEEEAER